MVPRPTPISLLENSIDLQHNDSVFRSSPWSSNLDVDLKVIGHLPIGKRNSTPVRFGAAMPYKTNQLPPHIQQQQQQLPYPGPIPGPLVGNHFASNANPQIMNGTLSEPIPHRRLDRSLSEPARNVTISQQTQLQIQQQLQIPPPPQLQPQVQPQSPSGSSRYKTELCRPFAETGFCKYGEKCQFAHGGVDLRSMSRHPKYKTELCRTFHTTGLCGYGTRCHFIHNADERRSPGASSDEETTDTPMPQLNNNNSTIQNQNHQNGVIQQRMMYLDNNKSSKQGLSGLSPPSSFDGSPTDSAGSFFGETYSRLPDFFSKDSFSKDSNVPIDIFNSTEFNHLEIPPLIGNGLESPPDSPPDSLVGDMDNLSISPESDSPPPYTSLQLSIGCYNGMMQQQQISPPMASERMQFFNQNNLLMDPVLQSNFRLPIFETLTEV